MAAKTDAVILALTALWQAAPAFEGVPVTDGPQVNSQPASDWLFVGADGGEPDEANEAAVVDQSFMAFAKTKQEDGEITCAVVSVRGDTNIPLARARAYALVSAAEDALRTDLTLGALVMHSFVSAHQYIPAQTTDGAKVRVVFTVTYQAQI